MPIGPAITDPADLPIEIVPNGPGVRRVATGPGPTPTNPLYRYVEGDLVWHDGAIWQPVYLPVARSIEDCRAVLHAQVSAHRGQLERLGLMYVFPDGIAAVVQTRDDTDVRNIQGNTTAAMVLQSQGVSDPVLTFRAADNMNHPLTPLEAIQMGMAVAARVTSLYQAKWQHDEAIDALQSFEECVAYDVTAGWD